MKKIISLLSAILILIGTLPAVYAQDVQVSASLACDFSNISGNGLEKGNGEGSVLLRNGEWLKFDITGLCLPEGSYMLSLRQANQTVNSADGENIHHKNRIFTDILLDNELVLKKEIPTTTSMTIFKDEIIGDIYIKETSKYITIKNSALHELSVMDFESFSIIPTENEAKAIAIYGAINAISSDVNIGYYDSASADFWSSSFTTSAGCVTLHSGDWVCYDVSDLAPGLYDFSISSGETGQPKMEMMLDGITKFSDVLIEPSTSYGIFTDKYFGKVYITPNSKALSIKNNGVATFVRNLTLTKISDEIVVDANDADDFYDINGVGLENGKAETSVLIEESEWISFDVSKLGIAAGNYEISVKQSHELSASANYKNRAFLDILVDSRLCLKTELSPSATSFSEVKLGIIEIAKDTKSLMIRNSALHESSQVDLENVILKPTEKKARADISFGAINVNSTESETGYHDVAAADFWSNSVTTSAGCITLHQNDWVCYDISGIPSGTYTFSMSSGEAKQPMIDVSIDGKKKLSAVSLDVSGSYGTYTDTVLNNIYITEGVTTLTIKNVSNPTYMKGFKLKQISDFMVDAHSYELGINNVYSQVEGEGYHDGDSATYSDYSFLQTGCFMLDLNDWIKFSVSDVDYGNYVAYALVQSEGTAVTLYENENAVYENVAVNLTDMTYRDFDKIKLGNITIDENTDSLKIENTGDAPSSILLKAIVLESAMAMHSLRYTSDSAGENEVVSFAGLNKVYLTGTIEEFNDNIENVTVSCAVYENGRLAQLENEKVNVGDSISIEIPINSQNASKIKTFVWNDDFMPYGVNSELRSGKETRIYVSQKNGDDTNGNGTQEKPFATITKAQEKIREINDDMDGDIKVFTDGVFFIDETLSFGAEDSGTNGFEIIYDGGNETFIYGGKEVGNWNKIEGTQLYETQVEGVSDFRQFYINGNRGTRARSKYLYYPKAEYDDTSINYINSLDGFIVSADDFDGEFSRPQDLEVVWQPSWKNIRMPVSNITKDANGDFIFTFPQPYFDSTLLKEGDSMPKPSVDIPFYIENAVEFLDEPGEWFYNKDTNKLYYYPMENEDMSTAECFVPVLEKLLSVNGKSENEKAENITFKGIQFSYGAWERPTEKGFITTQAEILYAADPSADVPSAYYPTEKMPANISVSYADNVHFTDNEFSHLGTVAVSIDKKTTNSTVSGNIFDDISASAVMIGDYQMEVNAPKENFCSNNIISDNLIRRTSVEYQTPIITAYYMRESSIRNNDIKDAPYTGISMGWGWGVNVENSSYNDITQNRIENVMYKLLDGGHIYTLDKQTGTVIQGNYCLKSEDFHGGVYHDNSSSGITVRNNVFEDCPKWVRMLYTNVKDNVGRNNYSNTAGSIDDKNDYTQAIGMTDGKWGSAAQEIIEKAGLSEDNSFIYETYEAKSTNYRNDALNWLKYDTEAGIMVPAGDYMEGGDGVAYHDISEVAGGLSAPFEPGRVVVGNGVNHHYLMMTGPTEWTKYEVDINEAGKYDFILTFASLGYQYVNVYIDDVLVVNKAKLNKTCDDYNDVLKTLGNQNLAQISLSRGKHTVKIEQAVSNFVPYSFRLVKDGETWQGRNDGFDETILSNLN